MLTCSFHLHGISFAISGKYIFQVYAVEMLDDTISSSDNNEPMLNRKVIRTIQLEPKLGLCCKILRM